MKHTFYRRDIGNWWSHRLIILYLLHNCTLIANLSQRYIVSFFPVDVSSWGQTTKNDWTCLKLYVLKCCTNPIGIAMSVIPNLLKVGISHKYFKVGLVACGPYFLFIFIFINVRKQLLTFKLSFWAEIKGQQLNDSWLNSANFGPFWEVKIRDYLRTMSISFSLHSSLKGDWKNLLHCTW